MEEVSNSPLVIPPWFRDQDNLLLLVALLLCLWLWSIRSREVRDNRPRRPMPLTPDELGRIAFRIARSHDEFGWRDLFLNGSEARDELGDDSAAYLAARSPEVLKQSLDQINAAIPADGVFAGVKPCGENRFGLLVRPIDGGNPELIEIGSVVQVGQVWRIFGPARPTD